MELVVDIVSKSQLEDGGVDAYMLGDWSARYNKVSAFKENVPSWNSSPDNESLRSEWNITETGVVLEFAMAFELDRTDVRDKQG